MKAAFYTLGCKVNQYETQAMKERFLARGYSVVSEEEEADVYVVNTCTVTHLADRKSRQYIRRMKKRNPLCVTAVVGCYAQTSPEEILEMPEVDIVAGTNQKERIVEQVENFIRTRERQCRVMPREELTDYEETGCITSMDSRTRAYIKIQEGCDRFCSYCMIPYARGRVRSRDPRFILREAKQLLDQGFSELVLTGINTALYGTEPGFAENYSIAEDGLYGVERIIAMLEDLPGDFRVRLSSLEPTVVNGEYVAGLLKYKKLCHHVHLSLQSGSDKILAAMNRRYRRQEYLDIVRILRQADPGYGITTDIIVGFPGEKEEDFRQTLDIVKQATFGKVHVFPYSKRKGTAAADLRDQCAPEVKKRRGAELASAGEAAAGEFYRSCCGTARTVLFEEREEGDPLLQHGFADNYIKVYVSSDRDLRGSFTEVILEEPFRDGMKGRLKEKSASGKTPGFL